MSRLPAEDYGALLAADGLDISDVTSNEVNAEILRRLKNNDPKFTGLRVCGGTSTRDKTRYVIEDARGMGVLGYYLGRSTNVTTLTLSLPEELYSGIIEPFLAGLERNRSIETVWLYNSHSPRDFFRMMTPFIRDNPNLETFHVKECRMGTDQYRGLSLALREASKSLKHLFIRYLDDGNQPRAPFGHYDHEESIIANIEAMKMHPQLERIGFAGFTLGRNACEALSDLLQHSAAGIQDLDLHLNEIDDSGLEALLGGLAHCRVLRELDLSSNPSITVRGWQALSSLLEDPDSSLQKLDLQYSDINDESATIFANALKNNSTLETLYLHENAENIGDEGRKAFSNVLCNTSSVNSTFLSNHTLHHVCEIMDEGEDEDEDEGENDLPDDLSSLLLPCFLALNEDDDKKKVAVKKILTYHDDFDMKPLYEWDLKVLPFVIGWFERAVAYGIEWTGRIGIGRSPRSTNSRRLDAIYQFMRGMPELAIDGITGANKKSAKTGGEKRLHSAACE